MVPTNVYHAFHFTKAHVATMSIILYHFQMLKGRISIICVVYSLDKKHLTSYYYHDAVIYMFVLIYKNTIYFTYILIQKRYTIHVSLLIAINSILTVYPAL